MKAQVMVFLLAPICQILHAYRKVYCHVRALYYSASIMQRAKNPVVLFPPKANQVSNTYYLLPEAPQLQI